MSCVGSKNALVIQNTWLFYIQRDGIYVKICWLYPSMFKFYKVTTTTKKYIYIIEFFCSGFKNPCCFTTFLPALTLKPFFHCCNDQLTAFVAEQRDQWLFDVAEVFPDLPLLPSMCHHQSRRHQYILTLICSSAGLTLNENGFYRCAVSKSKKACPTVWK